MILLFLLVGIWIMLLCAVWVLAYIFALALIVSGEIYKYFTSRDARVKVPGSVNADKRIEPWMERKGYIRFD